ncbi:hypothetical protein D3C85_1278710 [compost metagenome]
MAENSSNRPSKKVSPSDTGTVIRTGPAMSSFRRARAWRARSTCTTSAWAWGNNAAPAAVRLKRRVVRCNNTTENCASSWLMRLDSWPLLQPSCCAARVKLPASINTANAARSSISLMDCFHLKTKGCLLVRLSGEKTTLN